MNFARSIIMAKKAFIGVFLLLAMVLSSSLAYPHGMGNFSAGQAIVDANTPCDNLAEDDLEEVGELYMERMHPGEAHEFMHERMGLEDGTEAEERFHVNLAKIMYCGEPGQAMGFANMRIGMGGGMMAGGAGAGMMGGSSNFLSLWGLNSALLTVLLAFAIAVLALVAVKLTKKPGKGHGRN